MRTPFILIAFFYFLNVFSDVYQNKHEPLTIRMIAKDAAWLWFNNESVLLINKTLYIGCEDSLGNSQVVMYQIEDNPINFSGITYDISTWKMKRQRSPTHNYASLLQLQKRKILAVYHTSSNQMYYRIGKILDTDKTTQRVDWGKETIVQLSSGINYSNLIKLNSLNKVFNFFSIYKQSPSMIVSRDNGKTWGHETLFMQQGGTGTSPYMRLCSNGFDRIDFLYTDGHPRTEMDNCIYHLYFKKHAFFRSDGSQVLSMNDLLKGPIKPDSGTKLYDGSFAGPGWVWDIEYDMDQNPVAAFITSNDGEEGLDLRYHYAKWDGHNSKWFVGQIAYAGNHLYIPENHFAGGITIDSENSNVVYISSNVDPVTGRSITNRHYQIYQGVTSNAGYSWSWKQLTFDDDRDNLRPIVPKGHNLEICVIWFSQKLNPKKGFDSEIRGIFKK